MKFAQIGAMPRLTAFALAMLLGAIAVAAIAMQEPTPNNFLGQGNLTEGLPNFINRFGLDAPVSVAIDRSVSPNHVYVADWNNNRVFGYSSAAGFVNGKNADLIFGEHNPGATNDYLSGFTSSTLFHPSGVAVDSNGNLFVADSGANRVLEYDTPFITQAAPATEVFGTCGDFTGEGAGCTGGTSAATLNNPTAITLDGDNNLWVVDAGNNRVVKYANPIAGGSNITASVVLGQLASFTSSGCNLGSKAPSADSLCFDGFDAGLTFDTGGNLFLSDSGNNRVLEYFTPAQAGSSPGTPGSGGDSTADEVFGQNGSFATTGSGESAGTLLSPGGIVLDGSGNLYIADEGNQRVVEYASNALNPPGVASFVLGRCGSFNASGCPAPPNIQTSLAESLNFDLVPLSQPNLAGGLAFDEDANLYIADPGNNRVLALTSPLTSSTTEFSGRVLGQASFVHNGVNLIDGEGYSTPWGVALDPSVTPNRLYVVDSQNSRVFGYQSVAALDPLNSADAVFGQPDFFSYYANQFDSTNTYSPTAGTMAYPTAAVADSSGNLYVADTGNSRVLVFLNPFSLDQADGFEANLVIGQHGSFTTGQNGNFTEAGCPTTPSATTLCVPNGLALDKMGNLYVVDAGYNRVLEFSSPSSSPTLVKVFGQPDATTLDTCSSFDPTAICSPAGGIAFDASGRMYVDGAGAGSGIGIYNTPASESSPDVVIPARAYAIALTSGGSMFISQGQLFQFGSSSVVEYSPPFTNASVPSLTFGPGFTLSTILPMSFSYGLGLDSSQFLYLADTGNNRALVFDHPLSSVTPAPTATATRTATPTATASSAPTPTATATATATSSLTASATATATPTSSGTATTATATPTASGSAQPTASASATATATATATTSPTPAATATPTATPTSTMTPSATPTPIATKLKISPASELKFGKSTGISETSKPKKVKIKNGSSKKSGITVMITGQTTSLPFAVSSQCVMSLAPGKSCVVEVTFSPTDSTPQTGELTITDDVAGSPQHVMLSGTGKAPKVKK